MKFLDVIRRGLMVMNMENNCKLISVHLKPDEKQTGTELYNALW
jgi:hypothetical protein